MTRYARFGNSQRHCKAPGDATSWKELSRNSMKNSSTKDGKFNRIEKGRIDKNKNKGNKVGKKSFQPTSQSPKLNKVKNPEKPKTAMVTVERKDTLDKLSAKKKCSFKKRKKNKKDLLTKEGGKNVTSLGDIQAKKSQNGFGKHHLKSENKVLNKNRKKKANRKKKLELLKSNKLNQNESVEEKSESSIDKEFLNKKNSVLEKLKRKTTISIPLPSKVERKIFYIKKKLREKGLSPAAIRGIMNKERMHEEEKFLKTCTTKPCFNCRQIGHLLSNCPLKSGNSSKETASCYKCGSSEHTSSTCNKKIQGFPLAKCFVCKEQGHISKDCPQNKHGLYIKGGGCAKCGNVNHLQKDCPSIKKKKEEEAGFTLHTIAEGTSVDEEMLEPAPPKFKKRPNKPKVVKF